MGSVVSWHSKMSDEEEQESRYSNTRLSSKTAKVTNAAVAESKLSEVEEAEDGEQKREEDQTRSTEEEESASDDIDDDAEHSEDKGQLDEDIE